MFQKQLLIRILKRDNQLHLFRRLERCSEKQVNCETAVEFLKLCQNFNLTPTFARVDETKANKWRWYLHILSLDILTSQFVLINYMQISFASSTT